MNKETKETIITGVIVLVVIIVLIGGFLWYMNYMFDKTEQDRHNDLKDNLVLNNSYKIISISSDFVCCNECKYFVSIKIKNETNEITLNDFNYDICEDKLYYGWYERNDLDEMYGIILNQENKKNESF